MCGVCGCGGETARIEAHGSDHHHHRHHGHEHGHDHGHEHEHVLPDGGVMRHSHAPRAERIIAVERDILEKNDRFAALNRRLFRATRMLALNLVSSPGAGKTTLLVATLAGLRGTAAGVIEGDQQTSLDAERIRATGAPAVQVNTGKGCHLDAGMVAEALPALDLPDGATLFIENVGNLVCPAGFDLGEAARVLVCSVTEGEDKPLKYPDMFASADLLIVSKADLLPHLEFDLPRFLANARRVKPGLPAILLSTRSGEGMAEWQAWLAERRAAMA
jgi:hydrogenase nickel incorporation protein HypB